MYTTKSHEIDSCCVRLPGLSINPNLRGPGKFVLELRVSTLPPPLTCWTRLAYQYDLEERNIARNCMVKALSSSEVLTRRGFHMILGYLGNCDSGS
jgi:hypothetical protein